jgi:hypothetical protein
MNRINTVAEALRIRALTVGNALHGTFWSNESGQRSILAGLKADFKLINEDLGLWLANNNKRAVVIDNGKIVFMLGMNQYLGLVLHDTNSRPIRSRAVLVEDEVSKRPGYNRPNLMEAVYTAVIKETKNALLSSNSMSDSALAVWRKLCKTNNYLLVDDDNMPYTWSSNILTLKVLDTNNIDDIIVGPDDFSKTSQRILLNP